jgi:sugar phosphate permease
MQLNYWILLIAGAVPLLTGFVWYHPKVFGTAWMKATGLSEESLKGANMAIIFGVVFLFGLMLASALMTIVIHQMGFNSIFQGDTTPESATFMKNFFDTYSTRFRTFKHGALHGTISGIFIALPVLGINALFERKSVKYILIHTGYWALTMALMGGILCGFM